MEARRLMKQTHVQMMKIDQPTTATILKRKPTSS